MPRSQGTSSKGKPKKGERAAGMGRALQKAQRGGKNPSNNRSSRTKGGGMNVISTGINAGSTNGSGGIAGPTTSLIGGGIAEAEHRHTSLLEVDHLDDFLIQAEMAGREFESEKSQFVVLDNQGTVYKPGQRHVKFLQDQEAKALTTTNDKKKVDFSFEELSVPRRPEWDETTTPEELDRRENESFLEWRRAIAAKEEELFASQSNINNSNINNFNNSNNQPQPQPQQHIYYSKTVTPYEKNLQVWRQLWRVIERCNCIVQLVDGRNPIFYLSEDLRNYATREMKKPMMLIVNKADYLSPKQRQLWSEYLTKRNWEHVFFSAHIEQAKLDKTAQQQYEVEETRADINPTTSDDDENNDDEEEDEDGENDDDNENDDENEIEKEATFPDHDKHDNNDDKNDDGRNDNSNNTNNTKNNGVETLLTREELMDWMHDFAKRHGCRPNPRYENRVQFGTVGFPNVGKSSVINVLMGSSKHTHGLARVGVAAQPGKTKHFQTLLLPGRDDMMLCDCPGLVFPSFVSNTADLIAAGVYPIAQMREFWPVVELICQRIPREIINASYGITLPVPSVHEMNEMKLGGENGMPPPTAEEFLTTYCIARSMLAASSGVPDFTRAARIVIKDYVSGKLLYCHPPPNDVDWNAFHVETVQTAIHNTEKLRQKLLKNNGVEASKSNIVVVQDDDEEDDDSDNNGDDYENNQRREELFDSDILDILGDDGGGGGSGGGDNNSNDKNKSNNKGGGKKSHKKKKGWGKKGRKLRDDDPYGCHKDPDEMLLLSSGGGNVAVGGGVVVNAGKYGRSGYTRITHYAGARQQHEQQS